MAQRTWQQNKRTNTRNTLGRFDKLNPCELCGKSAGADHYSDDRCNTLGYGLVLCKNDAEKCAKMSDSEYIGAFATKG